ncbi:Mrp/NBP35 family ATP-binding protein [Phenylobacterium sp.]|uniref:Mrp/NBP35 family ATP-binding protein n=1 Tax=Phenylobacterium sp. TaxID=1871053 RepID=UPI0027312ABB|nr:Mrp/NBP35 family ATP-binding protein [Phenylobacterium sp.]MDP2213038.1 Mrp/NBP35 family ATP-binding protein [Phenylobacterium sp.]
MNTSRLPDRDALLAQLEGVIDPRSGKGLVSAGLVQGLSVRAGRAGFMMEVAPGLLELYEPLRAQAEAVLRQTPGVEQAQVVLTNAEGHGAPPPQPAQRTAKAALDPLAEPPLAPGVTRVRRGARLAADPQATPSPPPDALRPAHVRRVIAVASGKGGVGKSTVSVSLAAAFAGLGLRVGLLDADVYGPSAPRMLGVDGDPEYHPEKKLIPLEAWGIKVMSIGFMVDEGAPMIWRGPMASSAVRQMMHEVAWGFEEEPLDVLIVDMPPGTGDIQLTLIQKMKLDGVVIVTTPQEIALIDARRAASMFQKTATPILGLIENMAYFADPATGTPIPIFGQGGGAIEAERLGVPMLGQIPIDVALRQACDDGRPLGATAPDSGPARAFRQAAEMLRTRLGLARG